MSLFLLFVLAFLTTAGWGFLLGWWVFADHPRVNRWIDRHTTNGDTR